VNFGTAAIYLVQYKSKITFAYLLITVFIFPLTVIGSEPSFMQKLIVSVFLPTALWPWGQLGLWQKWVPWIFPGG